MKTVVEINGNGLSCEQLHAVGHGRSIKIEPAALQRLIERTLPPNTDKKIQQHLNIQNILISKSQWLLVAQENHSEQVPSDHPDIQEEFILAHCAGVGPSFPDNIVRSAIAARANVLTIGVSGVRPIAVQTLIDMLNMNIVPKVPSQGSVGAAGDLAPMAHIARVACGYHRLPKMPAHFTPLQPTQKETLALINGISVSSAIAANVIVRFQRVFDTALISTAMTMEAVQAHRQCLNAKALSTRSHPEVVEVGAELERLLSNSKRVLDSRSPDAFSIRAGPSVLGAVLRTLRFARTEVERELNGASDNPLSIDDSWVETGNFHGASLALAMDHLTTAIAQFSTLAERRIFRLTHGKLSKELPSFLVRGTGLNSGFMLAQYTAAALASEIKGLAHPASADSIPTVQHQEDHVSMSTIAARMALEALDCCASLVAIELLVAAQALDLRMAEDGHPLPPQIAKAHRQIRSVVQFWDDDKVLHPSISACVELVQSGALLNEPVHSSW